MTGRSVETDPETALVAEIAEVAMPRSATTFPLTALVAVTASGPTRRSA